METKTIQFDLETAKKIQAGEIKGKIKTKDGKDVRIICTDKASTDDDNKTQIVCLIRLGARELVSIHDPNTGRCWDIEDGKAQHLVLEVPDIKPQFKEYDMVLVRDFNYKEWKCALFSFREGNEYYASPMVVSRWNQCIPYKGNEQLVGTTDKPKEE